MLAGLPYQVDDELSQLHESCQALLNRYNTGNQSDLLPHILGSCGEGVVVKPRLLCDYGTNIHIAHHTFINYDAVLLDVCEIRIGAYCQFGPRVQIITATHPLEPAPRKQGWESGVPVTVGDNVWLAAGVIVCPGVHIGSDSVVGAGSVVTRDVPPGVLALGVPARPVRALNEQD